LFILYHFIPPTDNRVSVLFYSIISTYLDHIGMAAKYVELVRNVKKLTFRDGNEFREISWREILKL